MPDLKAFPGKSPLAPKDKVLPTTDFNLTTTATDADSIDVSFGLGNAAEVNTIDHIQVDMYNGTTQVGTQSVAATATGGLPTTATLTQADITAADSYI
jgi:hypothetical protein